MRNQSSLVLIVLFALLLASCTYSDGPVVSFLTKKQRVVNKWKYKKATINNFDITNRYDGLFIEFAENKDFRKQYILPDSSFDSVVEVFGRWDFNTVSKAIIDIRLIEDTVSLDTGAEKWVITKLKEDEMWLQFISVSEVTNYELVPFE